jgi:hypothetical protein
MLKQRMGGGELVGLQQWQLDAAEHALPTAKFASTLSKYAKVVLLSDSDQAEDETTMRFHLTYEGPLLGSSTGSPRARHKHEIRKVFHRQLKYLWQNTWLHEMNYGAWPGSLIEPRTPLNEALASIYGRGKYRFVPLVREQFTLTCSLDILFLRADVPGRLVQSGDIDNRLKTIFDALRMPTNDSEMGDYAVGPDEGEDPFYCLLEDDKLISHVAVATDMLLEPIQGTVHDARLIIDARITPYRVTHANIGFAS